MSARRLELLLVCAIQCCDLEKPDRVTRLLQDSVRDALLQVGKLTLQAQARDMQPVQVEQKKPGAKQKQPDMLRQQVGSRWPLEDCRGLVFSNTLTLA